MGGRSPLIKKSLHQYHYQYLLVKDSAVIAFCIASQQPSTNTIRTLSLCVAAASVA